MTQPESGSRSGKGPSGTAGLWEQLRASVARLEAVGSGEIDHSQLQQKLSARAERLRGRRTAPGSSGPVLGFLAFHKGCGRYGIPTEEVVEVLALEHLSPVPWAPPFVLGVIYWRGRVLSLLDLGILLGSPRGGLDDVHGCVVVEAAGECVAVAAHEVEDLLLLPAARVRPPPAFAQEVPAEWVLGIHENSRVLVRMSAILGDLRVRGWHRDQEGPPGAAGARATGPNQPRW